METRRVYVDYNATTPVDPEVLAVMRPWLETSFGNPSSIHFAGREAHSAIDRARVAVAALLNASASEVVFTSGGTEADCLALFGVLRAVSAPRRHLVVSAVEHPAVLRAAEELEREGVEVTRVAVDRDGAVDLDRLEAALRPETALVSVMLANNETGALEPVQEVVWRAKARGILVHCDAVQAVGRIPVDVQRLGVDLLSLSGHKIGAPKGVGALYIRRKVDVAPQLVGGGQEWGRRGGTENVPGIVALGAAAEIARRDLVTLPGRLAALRNRLEGEILARIAGVRVNTPSRRLCNTLSITLDGVEGQSMLFHLDLAGIAASTGSACASGSQAPSHVLLAMGRSPEEAQASLRFSFGRQSTDADVDAVVEALPGIVARVREIAGRGAA
jgi:cysteine desulfurase